jgi:aspartate/tyrosine/aromatic aminotransferase
VSFLISRIVGRHAETKKVESNILRIAEMAKASRLQFTDVVDATVGMLNHDSGALFTFPIVDRILKELDAKEFYPYAPVSGTKAFSEGVFSWVFGAHAEDMRKNFSYQVIPTTGGTAAISNAVFNFNDQGQKILVPNYYWTPYENIATEAALSVETFRMYDKDYAFNAEDFDRACKKLASEQQRVFVILNDPCNNPTGLCMSQNAWDHVVKTLNDVAATGVPVILLHDIAYIDYQMGGYDASRAVFAQYKNFHHDILVVVSFSGSKSFSLYGFRIGAQIGLSKNKDVIADFARVGDHSVRARFSSVSHPAMSAIGKVFTNPMYRDEFKHKLTEAQSLLLNRAEQFVKEAEKVGLKTLPYGGGFFIGIESPNKKLFQQLVDERIFVVPMPGLIRVAISSTRPNEIERLVATIKKYA